jgi:NADH-quinone oxidoreductase subunit M
MLGLPLISLIIFLPLLGALAIACIRGEGALVERNAKAVALLTTLTILILVCILLYYFDASSREYQFAEKCSWISFLENPIYYQVGVDGISLLLVALTALLMPIVLIASGAIQKRVRSYLITFLSLETMMMGTFCATDIFLFYLFFEGVLIPMFLIIGIWGGENRVYSTFKFFLYTLLGSIFSLIAIIAIYLTVGSTSFEAVVTHAFSFDMQVWLWIAFFASFAIKVPMWPFHTWLPFAHVEAPTAGSVILAAILLKMGGYGFVRFSLPMFTEASIYFAPFIYALSIIAVIYTSLVAFVQQDMKKLIAYSSIAHMGFVTFGIFTFSTPSISGAVMQMISHGLISGGLFLCVGVLYDRMHTRQIDHYGGVASRMPLLGIIFMTLILGGIGLPGTSGFVGEILVLVASFKVSGLLTLGLSLGVVFSATYSLLLYKRVMLGRIVSDKIKQLDDLSNAEKITLIPLVLLVLFFGFYPEPILKMTEASVKKTLEPYKMIRKNQKQGTEQNDQML